MDINVDSPQWSITFLIKTTSGTGIKMRICQKNNQLKNYTNQLLENFKKGKVCSFLKTKF